MKKYLFASAILALGLATARLTAAPVEADPNKTYDITPAAGVWMISAASYQGPDAPDIAHRLVLDLRRAYNLPAYVFNRGAEERRQQEEHIRQMRALCPEGRFRVERIEEQVAVLVGGYKDMESARKALDPFKKLKPLDNRAMDLFTWQEEGVQNGQKGIVTKTAYVTPFVRSFVMRNPTVPAEQATQDDEREAKFLRQLNDGESFSIYNCKKPWTLAIAVFASPTMITPQSGGFIDKLTGRSSGEILSAAALSAHNLADLLRKQDHMEVYVFHTRYNSVVTLGSFDRKDDPQLLTMAKLQRFKTTGAPAAPNGNPTGPNIFLSNPLPVEVPH